MVMRVKPGPDAPLASVWRHGRPAFFCAGIISFFWRSSHVVIMSGLSWMTTTWMRTAGGCCPCACARLKTAIPASAIAATTSTAAIRGPVILLVMTDSFRATRGRQRVPVRWRTRGAERKNLLGDEGGNDTPNCLAAPQPSTEAVLTCSTRVTHVRGGIRRLPAGNRGDVPQSAAGDVGEHLLRHRRFAAERVDPRVEREAHPADADMVELPRVRAAAGRHGVDRAPARRVSADHADRVDDRQPGARLRHPLDRLLRAERPGDVRARPGAHAIRGGRLRRGTGLRVRAVSGQPGRPRADADGVRHAAGAAWPASARGARPAGRARLVRARGAGRGTLGRVPAPVLFFA